MRYEQSMHIPMYYGEDIPLNWQFWHSMSFDYQKESEIGMTVALYCSRAYVYKVWYNIIIYMLLDV